MQQNFQRIEMFGYPGSGKTTAMKHIQRKHANFVVQHANFRMNFKSIIRLLVFLLKNPTLLFVFKMLKYVPKSLFLNYSKTIIRFILRVMVAQQDIKHKNRVLVDEGILQITWSLFLLPAVHSIKFNAEKELSYISKKWWPTANILIYYIKITDEEYIKRIGSRERVHFFSKAFKNKDSKYIMKGREISELLLKYTNKNYVVRQC